MKRAVIIHGMPSVAVYFMHGKHEADQHWLLWLKENLIAKGIKAEAPEMPEPFEPKYEKWRPVFEEFKPDEDTMLIGHSCGAGFLVRFLSENKIKVGKVALVAPWFDPDKELKTGFFDFKIDSGLTERTAGTKIIFSNDDVPEVLKSVEFLKLSLPGAEIEEMTGQGHFVSKKSRTEGVPGLLDFLLS